MKNLLMTVNFYNFIYYNWVFISLLVLILIYILSIYIHVFKLILKISLVLFIIIFFLFARFRERIDHPVTFQFVFSYFFLALFIFALYLFALISLYKAETSNIFTKFFKEFSKQYENGLKAITELLFRAWVLKFLDNNIHLVTEYCIEPCSKYYKEVYLFIFIFPRILLVSAFFCDVIIFQYMHYLYKILWIIWIPILFRIFLYV